MEHSRLMTKSLKHTVLKANGGGEGTHSLKNECSALPCAPLLSSLRPLPRCKIMHSCQVAAQSMCVQQALPCLLRSLSGDPDVLVQPFKALVSSLVA